MSRALAVFLACALGTAVSAPAAPRDDKKSDDKKAADEKKAKRPALDLRISPRFAFSPAEILFTAELTGGDDWLGPITITRVDRPALADVKLRVKEPGSKSGGFRAIDDPRQHLLFLPDTEVELTLATRDRDHRDALLETMRRWGYRVERVR